MKTQTIKLEHTPKKIIVRALTKELKALNNNPNTTPEEIKEVKDTLRIVNAHQIKVAKRELDKIETILQDCGVSEPKFYSYSGRCMYGEQCVGVNVDRYEYQEIVKALKSKKVSFNSDNMGMDMVVYFTGIPADYVLNEEE